MSEATPEETAALLAEVFPGTRVGDADYLRWLYEASPFGRAVQRNRSDELGLSAHYAVVPVAFSISGEPVDGALSLNTAVHQRARGAGAFVTLARATYAAAAESGARVVIGVGNANSTHGLEHRLEFVNHGPLPATLLVASPGRAAQVRSGWSSVSPALLEGVDGLLTPPAEGLARRWTAETLQWRLRSPGSRYALHRTADALVVSTTDHRRGLRVAVVLAVFAARELQAAETRSLIRALCRFHRTPVALHVGINHRVRFTGPPLPVRLRPSPLNLVLRTLDDRQAVPAPARFEFLDFDAY